MSGVTALAHPFTGAPDVDVARRRYHDAVTVARAAHDVMERAAERHGKARTRRGQARTAARYEQAQQAYIDAHEAMRVARLVKCATVLHAAIERALRADAAVARMVWQGGTDPVVWTAAVDEQEAAYIALGQAQQAMAKARR